MPLSELIKNARRVRHQKLVQAYEPMRQWTYPVDSRSIMEAAQHLQYLAQIPPLETIEEEEQRIYAGLNKWTGQEAFGDLVDAYLAIAESILCIGERDEDTLQYRLIRLEEIVAQAMDKKIEEMESALSQ